MAYKWYAHFYDSDQPEYVLVEEVGENAGRRRASIIQINKAWWCEIMSPRRQTVSFFSRGSLKWAKRRVWLAFQQFDGAERLTGG